MPVVFYISGHGFGHASREVEIIHALHALRPDVPIIVRSAVNPSLLQRTLSVPFDLRAGACDTGIVQASSIQHDDPATVREAVAFYRGYEGHIEREVRALAADSVELVVSDIAPVAFEVASRLNVPSVAIANFTWDWIYETHPGLVDADPTIVPKIRASYQKATRALRLPFHGGFEVFSDCRHLPLVARRPTRSRTDTRVRFGLPLDQPAALLSFGGYGLPDLDLASIDALGQWTILTTDRTSTAPNHAHANLVFIPEESFIQTGFRYEDLVAAVDVVVTKPGYGIIAECIACETALLYTSRGEFREYDVLVREMPSYLRCAFVSQENLLAGRLSGPLSSLMAQSPAVGRIATDGAEVAAEELSRFLNS